MWQNHDDEMNINTRWARWVASAGADGGHLDGEDRLFQ